MSGAAMAHNMLESGFISDKDVSFSPKWNSLSKTLRDDEKDVDGFDCNICLDSARDPVVTFCGHLFCWPCISKWINVKSVAPDADEKHPNCPVCKASISSSSLVPLYGCGKSASEAKSDESKLDSVVVPSRPPPSLNTFMNSPHPGYRVHENLFHAPSQSFHHQQYMPHSYGDYSGLASPNLGGTAVTSTITPTVGMFGEMVYARMFGTSDPSLLSNPYQNSFRGNNLRMRRQEMQLDRSLNRLSAFLLCCIILCLLLF